jgi:hypothetical protein
MKIGKYPSILACLILGLILGGPIYAQVQLPDVDGILKKFIEKSAADSAYLNSNYTHEEVEIIHNLENNKREKEVFLFVRKKGNILYKKLLSKNDVHIKNQTPKPKKEIIGITPELFEKFLFQFKREESIEDQKYWVLTFKPKPNFPEKETYDRVINNLTGEVWIASENYTFKKLVAHIADEVDYSGARVSGKVHRMDASVEAQIVDGHFAVSRVRIRLRYNLKFLFSVPFNGDSLITIHYQNYQRREP